MRPPFPHGTVTDPRDASLDGVLVVDKPAGPTSHDVVALARRCLRERRIGHTGTLDPLATGVLPLACGRATRLVRFLTGSTKDYEATIRFGVTTDSYDVTGSETGGTGRCPTVADVERALPSLRGAYLQEPPPFSAKQVAGRRAYALARRQEAVTLPPVQVQVADAALVRLDGAAGTFRITCSAGFYVRAFAHALGQIVGTGACLEALRRTRSGEFGLTRAVTAEALQADPAGVLARLTPMNDLLPDLPFVQLTDEGRDRVAHGRTIEARHAVTGLAEAAGVAPGDRDGDPARWVRMLDREGRLMAVGRPEGSPIALHPSIVLT